MIDRRVRPVARVGARGRAGSPCAAASPPPSNSAELRWRRLSSWATRSRRILPDGSMRCVRSVSSGILVLEQMDEIGERHLAAVARAEDAQRDRQRARLLLMRRRVLQVQHVAERGRRQIGQQLLLVLGQLVDAVRQQRDRDRPARGAARRIDGDVDRVGELLALAAPLGELVVVGAPDVGVGVAAQVALAVDQHGRDAAAAAAAR